MDNSRVTFPSGALTSPAAVVRAERDDAGAVIFLDVTPFHPVDHTWPDQAGDTGALSVDGESFTVSDTLMGAAEQDGTVVLGSAIPVKRAADGWSWLVAHRLASAEVPAALAVGASVDASVDPGRRADLSLGHTACHLAALALNEAVAALWSKPAGIDGLGQPDFDGRACQTSTILPNGSRDEYRLGKSLRKAGFDTATVLTTLDDIARRINETLATWVTAGGVSRIEVAGPTIIDRRTWVCDLPGGQARILCGGTHASSLAEFASISVSFESTDDQSLVMTTTAIPA